MSKKLNYQVPPEKKVLLSTVIMGEEFQIEPQGELFSLLYHTKKAAVALNCKTGQTCMIFYNQFRKVFIS